MNKLKNTNELEDGEFYELVYTDKSRYKDTGWIFQVVKKADDSIQVVVISDSDSGNDRHETGDYLNFMNNNPLKENEDRYYIHKL